LRSRDDLRRWYDLPLATAIGDIDDPGMRLGSCTLSNLMKGQAAEVKATSLTHRGGFSFRYYSIEIQPVILGEKHHKLGVHAFNKGLPIEHGACPTNKVLR